MKEQPMSLTYTAQRGAFFSVIATFGFLIFVEVGAYCLLILLLVHNVLLKIGLLGVMLALVLFVLYRLLPALWTKHQLTETQLVLHYGLLLHVAIPRKNIGSVQPVHERLSMFQTVQADYQANKRRIVACFSEEGQVLLTLDQPVSVKMGRKINMTKTFLINVDKRDEFLDALGFAISRDGGGRVVGRGPLWSSVSKDNGNMQSVLGNDGRQQGSPPHLPASPRPYWTRDTDTRSDTSLR